MPELHLVDEETSTTYVFNLTQKDFARATTDLQYRTQLLTNAKNVKENATNVEENATNVEETAIQDVMQDITNVDEVNDGFRWVDKAVKLLLTAYTEHEHLLNTCKISVKRFWEIISETLKEKLYDITGLQCKSKFNGLKKTYKNIKDHNNKSGNNRRTWPYFEFLTCLYIHHLGLVDRSGRFKLVSPMDRLVHYSCGR
ncbi:uncharacterized protein LOC143902041 [Temnothorax americanus]|uniref:uncharacterized protein LOC143902041 n=1 Tax=Temnothorax americanus TaxID=1964332 RepID=UPI004068B518